MKKIKYSKFATNHNEMDYMAIWFQISTLSIPLHQQLLLCVGDNIAYSFSNHETNFRLNQVNERKLTIA